MAPPPVAEVLSLLRCPHCTGTLDHHSTARTLRCRSCDRRFRVADGIPRFVRESLDGVARRTQDSFGYEWTHFSDWKDSGETNFAQYFGDLELIGLKDADVLDAGCGMGRHARQIAPHARRVVAMDFSRAIEQAAQNTASMGNVWCIQGDVTQPPLADETFDFVYSLGVLHHLSDTSAAARSLVAKVKPGGRFRLYLYWRRSGIAGGILKGVAAVRRLTTHLPFSLLKPLCWVLSVALFAFVVVPYRLLSAFGFSGHQRWPLALYARYPFRVLYNDQFDRFSAPIEQRWTRSEVEHLLRALGLERVRVWSAFGWIGEGRKPDVLGSRND
jgi:SAM-dependent methyltransferase